MPPLILSDKAHITQGDLPHWDDKKAIYFATFRLADSLPITAMKEFRAWEEDKLESFNHGNVATTSWEEFERERQDLIEKLSDKGHGACILQRPNIRQVVGDTLLHYDKLRYWVHCFVIMPNHVHVMFECAEGYQMQEILSAWKSFSAHQINKILQRKGPIWQKESFDRIIRNNNHYVCVLNYIAKSPLRLPPHTFSDYFTTGRPDFKVVENRVRKYYDSLH